MCVYVFYSYLIKYEISHLHGRDRNFTLSSAFRWVHLHSSEKRLEWGLRRPTTTSTPVFPIHPKETLAQLPFRPYTLLIERTQ